MSELEYLVRLYRFNGEEKYFFFSTLEDAENLVNSVYCEYFTIEERHKKIIKRKEIKGDE